MYSYIYTWARIYSWLSQELHSHPSHGELMRWQGARLQHRHRARCRRQHPWALRVLHASVPRSPDGAWTQVIIERALRTAQIMSEDGCWHVSALCELNVRDDDDCFYYHSWRNNVVIAFGTLSSFVKALSYAFVLDADVGRALWRAAELLQVRYCHHTWGSQSHIIVLYDHAHNIGSKVCPTMWPTESRPHKSACCRVCTTTCWVCLPIRCVQDEGKACVLSLSDTSMHVGVQEEGVCIIVVRHLHACVVVRHLHPHEAPGIHNIVCKWRSL